MEARTGRQKQRYEDEFRLVAGCIPYKIEKNVKREKRLIVLMISSPDKDNLVFPKGGWEDDETLNEAACREAFEEAGVKGTISEKPLGVWEFRSKSSEINKCFMTGICKGFMFGMEVTQELHSWPQQSNYNRNWLTTEDAFRLCRYDWMREALKTLLISEDMLNKTRDQDRIVAQNAIMAAEHQMTSNSMQLYKFHVPK